MELMTLDEVFQPNELFENYESLIWTERYATAGDFQLTSNNISEAIRALPRESYVTLRNSTVPMVVEDHKIENLKNQTPKVTITGRSFEACALERRASVKTNLTNTQTREAFTISAAKESDAAYLTIRKVIGDADPRYVGSTQILSAQPTAAIVGDELPMVNLILPDDFYTTVWDPATTYPEGTTPPVIVMYPTVDGSYYVSKGIAGNTNQVPSVPDSLYWTLISYDVKPGQLYATVLEQLAINGRGIKSIRPTAGNGQIGIEIYNGANLIDEYVIDARFDQIDDSTYLLSERGSANVAYVYGQNGGTKVLKTAAAEPTGMARRVLLVDESTEASLISDEARTSRGLVELYNNNAVSLFGGEIADQIANDFNTKYFLGDILKLQSEYGPYQLVRVAEFIRSSDASGEKFYPTFETIA